MEASVSSVASGLREDLLTPPSSALRAYNAMPTSLSCRSSSALDSLPRNANARRPGTALHRLQQKQRKQQQSDDLFSDGLQLVKNVAAHSSAAAASSSSSSSPAPHRRSSKQFGARRRKSSNTKKYEAVSSGDLPQASSDLYVAQGLAHVSRDAFSDGEEEFGRSTGFDESSSIRIVAHRRGDGPRPRTLSLSPQKMFQPIMMPIESNESDEETSETAPTQHPPPTKRQHTHHARKRIITKDMIGKPTNFQHTGHIGAGSVYDAEKLKQQLSEVAAALRLEDPRGPSKGSESTMADDEASLVNSSVDNTTPTSAQVKRSTSVASDGVKRTTSKRKPVPAPRKLSELYSEFAISSSPVHDDTSASPFMLTRTIAEEEEKESRMCVQQENMPAIRVATIRAGNGKRLVEGPTGALITETANGRWNKALNEIKMALKDESYDDDGDESTDVQQNLDRADTILRRLNAI